LKQGLSEDASRGAAAGTVFVPLSPAEISGRFPQLEIIRLLGRGGMGAVYEARQKRLNRPVAVKILPVKTQANAEFAERFRREALALASLNHANIVTVYDFGESGDLYFFIMEFVEGDDLQRLISSHNIRPYDALNITVAISDALQYAHDQGVVHRDIKPSNILIHKSGKVKVADFGLARILGPDSPDSSLTVSDQSLGTPYYMAPEQCDRSQKVDHRADIYSLGVVMYEMLTGELPLGNFEPPSRKAGVTARVDDIVLKSIKTDPARRYQQAGQIKSAIEQIAASGFISVPPEKRRRSRLFSTGLVTAAVTAVVLIGLVMSARVLFRTRPSCPPQDAKEHGGNYYKVFYENVSWHEAREKCETMGGYLAVVRSKAEDEFVAEISRSHVWLGATDEDMEGQWTWLDGTPMTYSNWDRTEPNNAVDRETGEGEHYLMISKYAKWNDLSLNSPVIKGFVCEWDGSSHAGPTGNRTPAELHAALKRTNPRYNEKGVFEVCNSNITAVNLMHAGVNDLSVLNGLPLTSVNISWSEVMDLSPLQGMPLNTFEMSRCGVTDLSPLAGAPLVEVRIDGTKVGDLSPLKGTVLTYLDISHTRVTDLSPLTGMPLEELHMNCVRVTDLSPLVGMPLKRIGLLDTPVKDLSALGQCTRLESVDVSPATDNTECLRNLPNLKRLNGGSPAKFWLKWEELTKGTAAR